MIKINYFLLYFATISFCFSYSFRDELSNLSDNKAKIYGTKKLSQENELFVRDIIKKSGMISNDIDIYKMNLEGLNRAFASIYYSQHVAFSLTFYKKYLFINEKLLNIFDNETKAFLIMNELAHIHLNHHGKDILIENYIEMNDYFVYDLDWNKDNLLKEFFLNRQYEADKFTVEKLGYNNELSKILKTLEYNSLKSNSNKPIEKHNLYSDAMLSNLSDYCPNFYEDRERFIKSYINKKSSE